MNLTKSKLNMKMNKTSQPRKKKKSQENHFYRRKNSKTIEVNLSKKWKIIKPKNKQKRNNYSPIINQRLVKKMS